MPNSGVYGEAPVFDSVRPHYTLRETNPFSAQASGHIGVAERSMCYIIDHVIVHRIASTIVAL